MMPTPPNPRELKRRADFVAIVEHYGVKLHRAGQQFVGLCLFHRERTPSFYVDPDKKVFKCFGRCDAGGDIFDFVMRAEGCDFPSALRVVSAFEGSRHGQRGEAARFGRAVETVGFSARAARCPHSPDSRASIIARLDATEARNLAIAEANAASELVTACEPLRGEGGFFSCIYTSSNNFLTAGGAPWASLKPQQC